jgi:hypothetical protein
MLNWRKGIHFWVWLIFTNFNKYHPRFILFFWSSCSNKCLNIIISKILCHLLPKYCIFRLIGSETCSFKYWRGIVSPCLGCSCSLCCRDISFFFKKNSTCTILRISKKGWQVQQYSWVLNFFRMDLCHISWKSPQKWTRYFSTFANTLITD